MSLYSEELRRLLTCYDPRLEQKRIAEALGASYETVRKSIKRLRNAYIEENKITAVHMRILEALGLEGALVRLDPEIAPRLAEVLRSQPRIFVPPVLLEGIVPLPGLVATILYTEEGRLYATYRLLKGLEAEIIEELGRDNRVPEILDEGVRTAPIRACIDAGEADGVLERLLSIPPLAYGEKMLLDLLVYTALDYNPFASSRRMPYLEALAARLGSELPRVHAPSRLLSARYRVLSREGLLGRVYYVKYSRHLSGKHLVIAHRDAAPVLYRVGVEKLSIVYVGRGRELTVATASDVDEGLRRRLYSLGAGLERLRFAAVTLPPVEHASCRGGWSMEPMSPPELAVCIGERASG